jgi:hypothetical protein
MRFVKVVPLLVGVAMIAMAFVGTGSASAWSMCKKPEPVCPEFLRYHIGQVFTGALQEGTQAHFTGGTEAICKSSSFEDTLVTENGSLEGAMSLSMSLCNATVGVLHTPWKTEHIAIEPSGTWELRISNGGSGLPGFSINGCEYTAESIVLTLEDSSLTGGAPRVIANKELLTGAGACGVKGWTATYRESPNFYAG